MEKSGFTLIELLVVVLIIGILAAIALPQYQKAVERSRAAEAIQRLEDLAKAEQIHYMQNGTFQSTANLANMDIAFSGIDTPSYTIELTVQANGMSGQVEGLQMIATRREGQFRNNSLRLTLSPNGSIGRTCNGSTVYCALVATAGYTSTTNTSGQ